MNKLNQQIVKFELKETHFEYSTPRWYKHTTKKYKKLTKALFYITILLKFSTEMYSNYVLSTILLMFCDVHLKKNVIHYKWLTLQYC
jgi:hypothetical protein